MVSQQPNKGLFEFWTKIWPFGQPRVHHFIAFFGLIAVNLYEILRVRDLLQINQLYFNKASSPTFSHFVIGGMLIISIALILLSLAGLFYGRALIILALLQLYVIPIVVEQNYATASMRVRPLGDLANGLLTWGNFALVASVIISALLIIFVLIGRLAKRIDSWVESKSDRFVEKTDAATPVTISVLAILALVFSFGVPLLGLILGYLALNDIAFASGRKTGKDVAISAIVISIFNFLLLVAVLIGLWSGFLIAVWQLWTNLL